MKVDKEKIKEAIEKSGYLVEQKVINEFEKAGFFAGANYAFEDQDEHRSREVDFIATKYTDFTFGKTGFYFFAYGEVKKKSDPLVFFERQPQGQEFLEYHIPITATQMFFTNIDVGLDIQKLLNFKEIHHQIQHGLISTQFCVVDQAKRKAEHKNLYESLFVPLLKCVDSEIHDIGKNWVFDPMRPSYFLGIFLPLLVISGPLLSYNVHNDELTEKDYIIYRRHYSSGTVTRTLLIDIVSMKYLEQYLSDKLTKTYQAFEETMAKNIDIIFDYCLKDRAILDLKVKEMLAKQGYKP
ncbi:hypothetical protein Tfer_3158 [Thermincola ferriacetica]|uniref:Uncharacterized protein n=1 Tax=Thermincola ferriacetica TaxID=281456 RepID=A0A0L6VYK0_9FIRM|nr:hypothetical protein [Thermincola ferriacetica]KNZ68291.1 hypothetical protein Tfer_3158 [Thermincola ferriacetica]